MIKERWLQLSEREKQTVAVGVFFLILFSLYYFIWSPLSTKVVDLKKSANDNVILLHWMQETDQKINSLQKNYSHNKVTSPSLSILQNAIQQSDIAKNLSDMQQKDKDIVQLHFKEVSFDKLMTWLINHSSEGWTISEFSITKSSKPGMVSAIFQLRL